MIYSMASRSHSRSRRSRKQLRGGTPAPITGFVTPRESNLTPFAGGGCSRRGGSVLNEIAIPAVFFAANSFAANSFAANSMVGNRRKSMKKRRGSRRVRFSRRRL
jgi:hypothetical protein